MNLKWKQNCKFIITKTVQFGQKDQMLGDQMHGYWEWFRKDGVIMRSGKFDNGKQIGEWTTYDKQGKVYKVTNMKNAK